MTDKVRKYLFDILESAESIEKYIENIDFFQNQKNKMVRRAVERELNKIRMKAFQNTNWWWHRNFLQTA
jgi:uncharacterized protein with HEPN domain